MSDSDNAHDVQTLGEPGGSATKRSHVGRRGALSRFGVGAAAIGAAAVGAAALSAGPADAQAIGDADILNFALNFEYLGANYYLRATTGQGLAANFITGTGLQGQVGYAGGAVPFVSNAVAQIATRLAFDEVSHVALLRTALGAQAIAQTNINLASAWTSLAVAAGLIPQGQTFNPFSSDLNFLLGAYVLEDVCVSALAGAAGLLSDPNNVDAAAGLLGAEGYQAGAIRSLLANMGAGYATDLISNLRSTLSAVNNTPNDVGTSVGSNTYRFSDVDNNALVFRRTPAQVLSIAYSGNPAGGGFFPNRVNGRLS